MENINLLMISWDPSAATESSSTEVRGEVKNRQVAYGRHLAKLHMVTYAPNETAYREMTLSDNVFIHPTRSSRLTFVMKALRMGRELITSEGINLITCQDPLFCGLVGYILGRHYGIPVVMDVHGDFIDNPYWIAEMWRYRPYNLLAKYLIRRADAVRVDSSKIKEQMYRQFDRTSETVYQVPVFADTSRFSKGGGDEVREEYSRFEQIVLFVGRMVESKNVPNLLRAVPRILEHHPDVLFLLVGSGPLKEAWEAKADEMGVAGNVVFTGHVPE
ncbi:MAG: glycosyltransferase family 4 protein, partial [Candidatus Undinarchaeales archaeon]|nr:glycosyltransferase family 4 protein [Candidatus Undinarchaeales archaeon]